MSHVAWGGSGLALLCLPSTAVVVRLEAHTGMPGSALPVCLLCAQSLDLPGAQESDFEVCISLPCKPWHCQALRKSKERVGVFS